MCDVGADGNGSINVQMSIDQGASTSYVHVYVQRRCSGCEQCSFHFRRFVVYDLERAAPILPLALVLTKSELHHVLYCRVSESKDRHGWLGCKNIQVRECMTASYVAYIL